MKFEITDHPTTEDVDFLTQKINEEVPSEYGKAYPFAIFMRATDGSILAGCNGSIIFGEIYTDMLWVHPSYRHKGLARQLMEQVHQYGKQQGCTIATVETMDFQVPAFYLTLGYRIDFSRSGYNHGASCAYLSKKLD